MNRPTHIALHIDPAFSDVQEFFVAPSEIRLFYGRTDQI